MRKESGNLYQRLGQSARNPLLPFDEITYPNAQVRPRNKETLYKFESEIANENKIRKAEQRERLKVLKKINDRSYQQISFTESVTQTIEKAVNERIKLFKPDDTFVLMWNFFIIFAIAYSFLEIPLSLFLTDQVYLSQIQNKFTLALNIIFIIALFFDMVVRLNLAFYRHGKLITKRSQVVKNYARFDLAFDSIAWLVYMIYIAAGNPKLIYLKLFFYLKFSTLYKINSQIVFTLSIHRIRFCVYKIFRIIMVLWFITTWVSSIYFAIDYAYYMEKGFYYQTGQLWLSNSNSVDNLNLLEVYPYWYIWYEYAVYWSFQTSSTIGYGDVTPRNPHEVLYCNFIILINTVFFAFYINTIWQIISELQENYNRYINNWGSLREYLKSQGISKEFNSKIGNFLQEMWINDNEDDGEEEFTSILSSQLKSQVYFSVRRNIFENLPLFQEMKSFSLQWSELTKKLVFVLEKQKIGSGQEIYEYGEESSYLYFLAYGKVGLNIKQSQVGRQIEVHQHLGTQEFVTESRHLFHASALSFCVVWKLCRSQFISHLKQHPFLYYKYCELRERIVIEKEFELCNVQCAQCGATSHSFLKCPVVNRWRNAIVKPLYGYKKLQRSEEMQRRPWSRKSYQPLKSMALFCTREVDAIHKVKNIEGYRQKFNLQ